MSANTDASQHPRDRFVKPVGGDAESMNLSTLLLEREAAGKPVTVGLIGAENSAPCFLQARLTKGLHVMAVADLS